MLRSFADRCRSTPAVVVQRDAAQQLLTTNLTYVDSAHITGRKNAPVWTRQARLSLSWPIGRISAGRHQRLHARAGPGAPATRVSVGAHQNHVDVSRWYRNRPG
jgi:hypothetical protein